MESKLNKNLGKQKTLDKEILSVIFTIPLPKTKALDLFAKVIKEAKEISKESKIPTLPIIWLVAPKSTTYLVLEWERHAMGLLVW